MPAHPLRFRLLLLVLLASCLFPVHAHAASSETRKTLVTSTTTVKLASTAQNVTESIIWNDVVITSSSSSRLDDFDLDVIESVVRANLRDPKMQTCVLLWERAPGSDAGRNIILPHAADAITSQSMLNYRERNKTDFLLARPIQRGSITVMGCVSWERLWDKEQFKKAFPNLRAIFYMPLPGYNRDHTEALVVYYIDDNGFGSFCHYIDRLKRDGKHWRLLTHQADGITHFNYLE